MRVKLPLLTVRNSRARRTRNIVSRLGPGTRYTICHDTRLLLKASCVANVNDFVENA